VNFEADIFTHYGNTKGNAKSRNLGGLLARGHPRSSATELFNKAHDFLYDFNRNYASILYRFLVIIDYFRKFKDVTSP